MGKRIKDWRWWGAALWALWLAAAAHAQNPTTAQIQALETLGSGAPSTASSFQALKSLMDQVPPEDRQRALERLSQGLGGAIPPAAVAAKRPGPPSEKAASEGGGGQTQRQTSSTSAPPAAGDEGVAKPLRRFGYDLFSGAPSTFAPATDIPIPVDYVLGPGDTLKVQLFGKRNEQYDLTVGRDGSVAFPEIGPVSVAGLRFDAVRRLLRGKIDRQFIGVNANITLGELRSIRVFVLGDARQAGSYTVSALSTMTNALLASGGIAPSGSLRRVQLKRAGQVVTTLDLYALLLHGDTRGDARLQPGDVIFIPPVGPTVAVAGAVDRPAIYELLQERRIADVIALAGGLSATAYPRAVHIRRVHEQSDRTVLDVDLTTQAGAAAPVHDGDRVQVDAVLDTLEDVVWLKGYVHRPGSYQWHGGMRLSELLPSVLDLKPDADLHYVLVRRERQPQRTITAFSVDLAAALAARGGAADVPLDPRDTIMVFRSGGDRRALLQPVLDALQAQARHGQPAPVVSIGGEIRSPGQYPLEPGMRVSDLLRAGGRLQESAYPLQAELSRSIIDAAKGRRIEHVTVDLAAVLKGEAAADLALQPHDYLNIKELPQWDEQARVRLSGEVRFPGEYPIHRGETLSAVLQRAGGLTRYADPRGAVFVRKELQAREQHQMDRMANNLEQDLVTLSLATGDKETDNQKKTKALITHLISQLRTTQAVGRLVIDFPGIAAGGGGDEDVTLQGGDSLYVPPRRQEVTVMGQVYFPTSHLFDKRLGVSGYIDRSGGFTPKADPGGTYIVRADGTVEARARGGWFHAGKEVESGDTIIIPLDVHRGDQIKLWTDITQVMYQLSITVVALHTLGLF